MTAKKQFHGTDIWLDRRYITDDETLQHKCGNCRTPHGVSSIKCRNDKETK